MPTTSAAPAVKLQTPRVVKCPTPQCPGWITLDIARHQTEPCRYCRVGVDTLRFLLSRVGAEHKALPAQVHDEFNHLMLTMAGMWGRNVYLSPSSATLVDLAVGARGVTVEYNPLLGAAGQDGAAPLVGTILHKLLHFEAHLGQRTPQLEARSAAKEKAHLGSLLAYLAMAADHAYVAGRLKQLYPTLYEAQARWGLDLAQMLVGSESMFNRYLSERNLNKLVSVLQSVGDDAAAFRNEVMSRLAALTEQILGREKEENRRLFIAIQGANIQLLNPDAAAAYTEALTATGLENVRDTAPMTERLYSELATLSAAAKSDSIDPAQYHHALEGALKALGMSNYFEVKG